MWREIKEAIHANERFLITTHVQPDGDGIGSAAVFCSLLEQMGKTPLFFCDGPLPDQFSFLDFNGAITHSLSEAEVFAPQVLIVLDTHSRERIGRAERFINACQTVICIDHHQNKTPLGQLHAIDPQSCSTGAMLYSLYKECGLELTKRAAVGFYVSVICDTGRFSNAGTSRKAHKIANECIKLGVDPVQIYSRLFEQIPLAQFTVFQKALQRTQVHFGGKVIMHTIVASDHPDSKPVALDLDWLHELNKKIVEVECSVIIQELAKQRVRVSIRTKNELDALQIAAPLGGGGHHKAAGAVLEASVDEVKEKILQSCRNLTLSV